MNVVHILGRIGKIDSRSFENGNMTTLSVATDESYKKDGQRIEKTEWHNIVFNGKLADVISKYFDKGDLIRLSGKLRTRSWEKDGQKHFQTEILANDFEFLPNGKKSNDKQPVVNNSSDDNNDDDDDDLPF
ncbi:single-stranded DNA-binding protein [Sphingobacterium sp. 1.A.4]|uniref:single-stranded DNA-binding protein n=1 Tax=Sphingobacterium sp. 1.A.4 TaxID=2044603 RepID=UPI000C0BF631|nr:single-stranded DNA-binding protein [Sphingobacterium sp. 1.A.4]